MDIWGFLGNLIKPAVDLVDELHTSEEERLKIKETLFKVQTDMALKAMEYEGALIKAKADVIKAEATGKSWMQRNWRPITMLTFLILVVCDVFGVLAFRLSAEAWTLLQIGLGGYVVGRSVEKIAPTVAGAMRKD